MDLILCHITADFDTLGAAVGLSRLHPGARIVLTGGTHPAVKDFLALHRDEYALIERRSVTVEQIRDLYVVDTQWSDRLGKAAEWLDPPLMDGEERQIILYDHHLEATGDIAATQWHVEAVGATTTLIVEQLQQHPQPIALTPEEATVMALGIHVDTGSLTFAHTTVRDAAALTWLMQQGANIRAIADYVEPGLSPHLQELLSIVLEDLQTESYRGFTLSYVMLSLSEYIPGLSSLATYVASLTESDVFLLGSRYGRLDSGEERVSIIGRSRGSGLTPDLNLHDLFHPLGGGGHPRAASLTVKTINPGEVLGNLIKAIRQQIPRSPIARELMSSPVRTIRPETTIGEAQRILLRYGHSGLSVVDEAGTLQGIISRRDIDIALHHGFDHAPVKGYMTTTLKTITPETSLPEIESLMVTYDIGRLPVLDQGNLVGIVTRTDLLRQLHQQKADQASGADAPLHERRRECPMPSVMWDLLRDRLDAPLWEMVMTTAQLAEQRGWQLYLVGGSVRDLLLIDRYQSTAPSAEMLFDDIDLVVDGFHQTADQAAGVELAKAIQNFFPHAKLQVHGRFQTAALLWHEDEALGSLWVDIATARTEFYPYPAANPEVEASSIRQDLYRRDFTINALAVRLTPPRQGELLDYFGGIVDLHAGLIRVLHANSFIEDPTRIYRAVRFAVRLGFRLEPQTEGYIHHAIASGIYARIQAEMEHTPALQTRLRRELKLVLEAPYWQRALQVLARLKALTCLHPNLEMTLDLWTQMRRAHRTLNRFDKANSLAHWQVLLELLIASLDPDERGQVAAGLQLPAGSIDRLSQLHTIEATIAQTLPNCDRPSQIVECLGAYDTETLVLMGCRSDRPLRRQLWYYLLNWAQQRPPLDGNDLKQLGYNPGKEFKAILETLRNATLDGQITTAEEARALLQRHFPTN
jgi:tRNA nucleotidyltransferase (CCA-adding enzyme)